MQKLTIQVIKAILTRSTQLITDMDPYTELTVQGDKKRTKVLINKGDMPEWNQNFQYILSTGDWAIALLVQVKEHNNIRDSLIGQATVQINPSDPKPTNGPKWYSLKFNKKPAGKIMLNISCNPYFLGYDNDKKTNQMQSNIGKINLNTQNSVQQTSPSKYFELCNNSDSKIIRLNTSSRFSVDKQRQKSQINFSRPQNTEKPFNIIRTNQTFYTGRRGLNNRAYSVEKIKSGVIISNQNSALHIPSLPYYIQTASNFPTFKR